MNQNTKATTPEHTSTSDNGTTQQTLKKVQYHLHQVMAPNWQSGYVTKDIMYQLMSHRMGYKFSIENVSSVEEGRAAYRWALYFNKMFEAERQVMRHW